MEDGWRVNVMWTYIPEMHFFSVLNSFQSNNFFILNAHFSHTMLNMHSTSIKKYNKTFENTSCWNLVRLHTRKSQLFCIFKRSWRYGHKIWNFICEVCLKGSQRYCMLHTKCMMSWSLKLTTCWSICGQLHKLDRGQNQAYTPCIQNSQLLRIPLSTDIKCPTTTCY